MVGKGGFEPPRLAAHDPKSCSSANSDTSPHIASLYLTGLHFYHSQVSEPDFRDYRQSQKGESGKWRR